jgi:hypothetical protein
MDNLLFWVFLGILGLLLYISPSYLVHRMYEGFAESLPKPTKKMPKKTEVNASSFKRVNLQPSKKPMASSQNQIQNLLDVLNTPVPLASPTAPNVQPTAPNVQPNASGAIAIPMEYETTRSGPQSTREKAPPSEALKHGGLYANTLPRDPLPGTQGMLGSMGNQARIPAERIVYIERKKPRNCDYDNCDKPASNPNCPDMRDYIRKDSIPCWGCKLR